MESVRYEFKQNSAGEVDWVFFLLVWFGFCRSRLLLLFFVFVFVAIVR
jgi:hypothetical protein